MDSETRALRSGRTAAMAASAIVDRPNDPLEGSLSRARDARLDRLAARAQQGDARARAQLCAQIAPIIERYLTAACREPRDVEDACQQILLRVLEALPRYRAQATPIRHWLITIAANHLRDRARTAKDVTVTAPDALSSEVERRQRLAMPESPGEQRDSFRELIAPLKRDQQVVLRLLYDHDLTPEQAGIALGRTTASVRQLHKRGLDALRGLIAQAAAEQMLPPR